MSAGLVVQSGSAARPFEGISACGDVAVSLQGERCQLFAIVDALGHGPDAARTADRLRSVLATRADRPLRETFVACDQSLSGLRGAVMSAVQVGEREVLFAGVGNVELLGPANAKRPACVPGILGREMKRFREYALEVSPGDRWVLFSDGVRGREIARVLASLRLLDPAAAAKAIIERAGRPDDDVSALVMDFGARR